MKRQTPTKIMKPSLLFLLAFLAANMAAGPSWSQGYSVGAPPTPYDVSPGDAVQGRIPVTNISDNPLTILVSLGDWKRGPGKVDGYVCDQYEGGEPRSARTWITFTPDRMTLQPQESGNIDFEVTVPDDRTLEGSYWGAILIEPMPSYPSPPEKQGTVKAQKTSVTRYSYVVFILLTIKGTEVRDARFSSFNTEPQEDGFDAVAIMKNMGNIFLKPKVWLEIKDASGQTVYRLDHPVITVLPESEREYRFELRDLPLQRGHYLVHITGDYGAPAVIETTGWIDLETSPAPSG